MPGKAPRCRLSAQRSLIAAAETCISRPYINFWLRWNTAHNSEGRSRRRENSRRARARLDAPGAIAGSGSHGIWGRPGFGSSGSSRTCHRSRRSGRAVRPALGAAGGDVGKSPLLVRGHHPLAVFREVLGTELADDVRQLDLPPSRGKRGVSAMAGPPSSKRPSVV